MKALFLSVFLMMASAIAQAQDVSKILDDNQCTPIRQKDGRISAFECAGSLGQMAEATDEQVSEALSDSTRPLTLDDTSSLN